jgi:hypothetical protein
MAMPRALHFVLSAPLLLAACAAPAQPATQSDNNTSRGPMVDLGGFVSPPDLAQSSSSSDMAKPPTGDMAGPPHDMTSSPADMAMTAGCGSITPTGTCVGAVYTYCDPSTNTLATEDCAAEGFGCEVLFGAAGCFF